ncbi:MAG: PLP-dependent aminotransferase family protein [bacterium]|nr:PLP-dependent aminotransferase family protein [bacterium]
MKSGLPERPAAELINLASLDIDHRLFPLDDFKRSINTVLVEQGGEVFKYGECGGYKPLREYVSGRMRIHGIMVEPEEILITNGSQGGLELILKLLTVPGSKVAVEFPTYSYMLPLLEYYKAEILEVPMKKGGMDLERLEQILDEEKPAFVYTIPNFQNPTGITTSQEHRERLLSLCEQYRVPIVEDAFEEEMKYFGKVPLPIKSMDRQHLVLYAGTFSKVLAPGIRVGWIAGEREFIERLTAIKKFSDISSNTLIQSALYEFCRQGYYELHIKRMHREFRKRMHAVINALKDKLANHPHVSWLEPAGGYLLWLKLKKTRVDGATLKSILSENGVAVAYGDVFYPASFGDGKKKGYFEHSLRLSISTLDVKEIKEGIGRLSKAVSQIY